MRIKYIDSSELIIHHAYDVSIDDLMRFCIAGARSSPTLYWADGIAFFYEQIPPMMNARIEEDFVNGKDHWAEVYYSKMKDYKDTLEMNDGEFRGAKIRVVNASKFTPQKDFVKWVKLLPQKEQSEK